MSMTIVNVNGKGACDNKRAYGIDNKGACGGRCVPTVVDPTILVFEESSGKMATGVPNPSDHSGPVHNTADRCRPMRIRADQCGVSISLHGSALVCMGQQPIPDPFRPLWTRWSLKRAPERWLPGYPNPAP